MISALKRQIESVRYMAHTVVPGVSLAFMVDYYIRTRDQRALGEMDRCAEKLKVVIKEYCPPSRLEKVPSRLEGVDNYIRFIKERY